MNIYPFKADHPDFDLIASTDSFFSTSKINYSEFVDTGFFTSAPKSGLYVYQIKRNGSTHLGLLASSDIHDYDSGLILKHENTIAAKEQEMMQQVLKRQAMIKPVLLCHPTNKKLETILKKFIKTKKPIINTELKLSNQIHKVWCISNKELISEIQLIFKKIKKTYIADGHHRCSTSSFLAKNQDKNGSALKYDRLLSAFFPFSDMEIKSYNRVVQALRDMKTSRLIAEISKYCDIKFLEKSVAPKAIHEMIMILPFESYKLTWKKSVLKNEDTNVLDTTLFNNYILKNIIGIEDIRTDTRVGYVEGSKGRKGVYERVIKHEHRVGFVLFPVKLKDFKQISDKNKTLPPKSTWFEPRMLNGLVVQKLKETHD